MMTIRGTSRPTPAAHRGQTIVLFALGSLVLLGVLGLALDGGYLLAKRRAMQNAADAAALAGASALAGNNAAGFTVLSTVRENARQNGIADPADPGQLTCTYLDNSLQPLASPLPTSCHDAPFAIGTAVSAVQVTVRETHPTFVMRALGVASSGTGATATAQIQRLTQLANAQAPFLPCGVDSKLVGANGNIVGAMSILETNGQLQYNAPYNTPHYYTASKQDTSANGRVIINPSAYSYDMRVNPPGGSAAASPNPYRFLIHKASGNETNGIERCSADGFSAWKGYNGALTGMIDIEQTLPLQGAVTYNPALYPGAVSPYSNSVSYASGLGGPVYAGTGQRSGPAANVPGAGGCAANQASNCIMLLPIVDNSIGSENGSNGILAARAYEAFYITTNNNGNEHYAALVKNWRPNLKGSPTYTIGAAGVTSILLVR